MEGVLNVTQLDRNSIDQKVGEGVKRVRKRLKIDCDQAAGTLGISPSEYRKLEGGLRRFNSRQLLKLAKLFRISPIIFFEEITSVEAVIFSTEDRNKS